MGRVIVAAILGGILLHAWEFASWMVTDIHKLDPHPQLKDEASVVKALEGNPRGIYWIPGSSTQEFDPESDEYKDWERRHKAGPIGWIVYDPEGGEPMPPTMMIVGVVLNILMALVLALIIQFAGIRAFMGRFLVGLGAGVFLVLGSDLKQYNWMGFTESWTHGAVIDHLVGALVLAVVMALVLRPGSKPAIEA